MADTKGTCFSNGVDHEARKLSEKALVLIEQLQQRVEKLDEQNFKDHKEVLAQYRLDHKALLEKIVKIDGKISEIMVNGIRKHGEDQLKSAALSFRQNLMWGVSGAVLLAMFAAFAKFVLIKYFG